MAAAAIRHLATILGLREANPAKKALLAKVQNIADIQAEIAEEIQDLVDEEEEASWDNSDIATRLREVRDLNNLISRVVNMEIMVSLFDQHGLYQYTQSI